MTALALMVLNTAVALAWNEEVRDYAEAVNNQETKLKNDKRLILCLDKLMSADTTDMDLYYGVYLAVLESDNQDAAGTLAEYIKDYMIMKPDLFIEGYSELSDFGKKKFTRLLAAGIENYAELDSETEAKAFFRYIRNYLNDKTTDKIKYLADIESQVLSRIRS
jgi:hypothetical protein